MRHGDERPSPAGPFGPAPGAGILHLGLGAFHRAHQAVFTEDAVAAAGGNWGVIAVAPSSRGTAALLNEQDGLFGVVTLTPGGSTARVVGVVGKALHLPTEPEAVLGLIADPAIKVITLTVTEKGYLLDGAGRLRREDAALRADLTGRRPPATVPGLLVRGLVARARADAGPLAVASCDNLPANGDKVAALVGAALELAGPAGTGLLRAAEAGRIADWVSRNVTFPTSMVDRIVPAADAALLGRAAGMLGADDRVAVGAEPFSQWVLADRFPGGRPRWELAGAQLTTGEGVRAWERAKLRVLNGAHSAVAYLGALAGETTIAEALALPGMRVLLDRLHAEDVLPTLTPPPDVDLQRYAAAVVERFANPAIGHRTLQVAMDGSQKLPQRLAAPAVERLAAGGSPRWIALAVAAWVRLIAVGKDDAGAPLPLDDPLADRLREAADASRPEAVVRRLLGIPGLFPAELAAADGFVALVAEWLVALDRHGAAGVLASVQAAE